MHNRYNDSTIERAASCTTCEMSASIPMKKKTATLIWWMKFVDRQAKMSKTSHKSVVVSRQL
jgi:hypothetical protein